MEKNSSRELGKSCSPNLPPISGHKLKKWSSLLKRKVRGCKCLGEGKIRFCLYMLGGCRQQTNIDAFILCGMNGSSEGTGEKGNGFGEKD